MGTDVECPHCKKISHYDSDEIDNIGKILKPKFTVICHHCSKKIVSKDFNMLSK